MMGCTYPRKVSKTIQPTMTRWGLCSNLEYNKSFKTKDDFCLNPYQSTKWPTKRSTFNRCRCFVVSSYRQEKEMGLKLALDKNWYFCSKIFHSWPNLNLGSSGPYNGFGSKKEAQITPKVASLLIINYVQIILMNMWPTT